MKSPPITALNPYLQTVSDRVRTGTMRVKVWTREVSARRAQRAHRSEPANPIYLLAAITLGIPILLMIPLILMNPGIHEGAFTNVVTFIVVAAFVIAALIEIKNLADQPSESDHH